MIAASIEHHHEIIRSRAEVYRAEIGQSIQIREDEFDRAVMLDVETGFERVRAKRPSIFTEGCGR